MDGETVFRVDERGGFLGEAATVGLADFSLTERGHFQEWVLAHPEIIGEDILIVASEFDRWEDASGEPVADRLDVLGLDASGRPVVVELKRGRAQRLTELQAVGYAAMVSRLGVSDLVLAHRAFLDRRTSAEPAERDSDELIEQQFAEHVGQDDVSAIEFGQPRIVILAEDFSPSVVSSVVWLHECGVEITLRRLSLYRSGTADDGLLATVTQVWPIADAADLTVRPRGRADHRSTTRLPVVPWSAADLSALRTLLVGQKQEATVTLLMDLAAESPDLGVTWQLLHDRSSRTEAELRSDLAHLTMMIKGQFGRRNWPFGDGRQGGERRYFLDERTAGAWRSLRGVAVEGQPGGLSADVAE